MRGRAALLHAGSGPEPDNHEGDTVDYANEAKMREGYGASVGILLEALPWIKKLTGKTVLIKYGGSAMESPELMREVMTDIVMLRLVGVHPVIVHGGGKSVSAAFERLGIPVEFKNGQRVTPANAMTIVREVLVGDVNQRLVDALNRHGHLAVGASGSDACTIKATQMSTELGRVGEIVRIDPTYIEHLIEDDFIPIIATVAAGDDGEPFNVNADVAAGQIAAAIKAHKIIFLTDVDGLYEDFDNKDSLVAVLSPDEARDLLASGAVGKGMIPKVESSLAAIDGGVPKAHIVNGKIPHSILLELLTDYGIGTTIERPGEDKQGVSIDKLTARLSPEEDQ